MKSLLANIMPYKGIGLYVGEDEVFVSKVASTPLGTVELARHSQPYEPEQLGATISQLLATVNGSHKNTYPIAIGVPTKRVFYSTRALAAGKDNGTAQNVLREVMQSPNVCIDELSVQVVKGIYAKRNLASVASCRREYLLDLLQTFSDAGVQPFRTEPEPFALLRAADEKRRIRKSKPALRLFLSPTKALAVVVAGQVCVFWKSFKLNPGSELGALSAAIRSSQTLLGHFGIDIPLDVVLVHGREDLKPALTNESFTQKVGIPVVWCEGAELSGTTVAYGLAIGCLNDQGREVIDLTQSMTPQPTIWQIFPWGEASMQLALVLCMALFLWGHGRHTQNAVSPVNAELAKRSWANNKSQADLIKEQRDLTQKVEAIKKFVNTRILWTQYTSDVCERLPVSATLTMFQGICELDDGSGKSKAKKSFTMRGEATIEQDGTMPKQIDEFLNSLRGDPLLKRDFPIVEVTDIKATQTSKKQELASAIFTVLCLPKITAPVPPPKPPAKGGHG